MNVPNHEPRRNRRKQLILLFTLMLVSSAVGFGVFANVATQPTVDSTEARILSVRASVARRASGYTVRRRFVGRVEAARRSNLGFEFGGLVSRVLVDEGDHVTSGQLLAELDTGRLRARRAELQAQLSEVKAARALAANTLKRTQEALEFKAVSVQQWDEAQQGLAAHKAVVQRVAAQIQTIEVDIRKSRLLAPFPGVVSTRQVDEGTVVTAGQPLLRLLEVDKLEVRVGISHASTQHLRVGQEQTVLVGDQRLSATVRTILPDRSQSTRTVNVILDLSEHTDGVRDGDLAEVEIKHTISETGFWLPRGALTESARGLWSCYVAEPLAANAAKARATHHLTPRQLEILHQEGERVFVRGLLSDKDLVVTAGLQRLVPHQHVNLAIGG